MDDDYIIDAEFGLTITELNPHLLKGWIWEMFCSRPGPIEEPSYLYLSEPPKENINRRK